MSVFGRRDTAVFSHVNRRSEEDQALAGQWALFVKEDSLSDFAKALRWGACVIGEVKAEPRGMADSGDGLWRNSNSWYACE
jgi:hypothetical protein